jgi:signal transduction histidine kinase
MFSTPAGSGDDDTESLKRLPVFINSLGDAFLAVNSVGIVEQANSMAHSLLDAHELKGKILSKLVPLVDPQGDDSDLLTIIRNSPEGITSRDYRLRRPADNTLVDVFISASPLNRAFGTAAEGGTAILIRDITREKSLEKERDEFISVASHEMRTPVAIAEGSISNAVLLAERSHLPDPIMHVLKAAHDQLIFLGSLINDLAMLSRADRGKLTTALEEVDINILLQQLQNDYNPQATKKGLIIEIDSPADLPKVTGSKLYIYEILQNFVTNAIKYTERGRVTVKAEPTGGQIRIGVSDTGIGIDRVEQNKLFSKFYRSEDFRVRQISGTGLGLYISAKLAGLMGGSIEMHSELNVGSTFTLILPASVTAQPRPEAVNTVA